jgi:hypothetical protein
MSAHPYFAAFNTGTIRSAITIGPESGTSNLTTVRGVVEVGFFSWETDSSPYDPTGAILKEN